jgi:hypothetical protein
METLKKAATFSLRVLKSVVEVKNWRKTGKRKTLERKARKNGKRRNGNTLKLHFFTILYSVCYNN